MGAFDWQVVWASLPYLAQGLGFTVQLTAVALAGGLVLGTLLALARISGPRPLALAAAAYVNIMRSVPLVMVILWFFLVIPMLILSLVVYARGKRLYRIMYILSVFTYSMLIMYCIDAYDLGRNAILGLLAFSALLMMFVGYEFHKRREKPRRKR